MTLSQACTIIDEALAYARSSELDPMTVAALDARGCIVVLKMEDGSGLLRPGIASGKAWGALGMGFGTRNLAGRAERLPAFFGALQTWRRAVCYRCPAASWSAPTPVRS